MRSLRDSVDAIFYRLVHEETGRIPTDRVKKGTKRSLITEAIGIPVGLSIGASKNHDIQLSRSTLEDCFRKVPILKAREWSVYV